MGPNNQGQSDMCLYAGGGGTMIRHGIAGARWSEEVLTQEEMRVEVEAAQCWSPSGVRRKPEQENVAQ